MPAWMTSRDYEVADAMRAEMDELWAKAAKDRQARLDQHEKENPPDRWFAVWCRVRDQWDKMRHIGKVVHACDCATAAAMFAHHVSGPFEFDEKVSIQEVDGPKGSAKKIGDVKIVDSYSGGRDPHLEDLTLDKKPFRSTAIEDMSTEWRRMVFRGDVGMASRIEAVVETNKIWREMREIEEG